MTDDLEDRLRRHLADRADAVRAEPDPEAFVNRSAGRSHRPGLVAAAVAALTVVVAGAGVLAGAALGGTGATASAPGGTTPPGRAGAALAPGGAAGRTPASIVLQQAYTSLFTRSTATGVTIRAYSAGSSSGDGCPAGTSCPLSTTVPTDPTTTTSCPADVPCAEPAVTPHATGGPIAAGGGVVPAPGATPDPCAQLVVELSTDRAVGTDTATLPSATPAADALQVLGSGSFGVAEGDPVSWVAVSVGTGVDSVQLSIGGSPVDDMEPLGGLVVLAVPGAAGLTGASVVGLDPSGHTVAAAPAQQVVLPAGTDSCASGTSPTTPPTTVPATTTTTAPAGAVPGPDRPMPATPRATSTGG